MGMMKDEHHETIAALSKPPGYNAAAEEHYSEQRRHAENKARQERLKDVSVAPPVTPHYEGRRDYPANPATDAQRFEKVCREADAEAKKTGLNIVVFKNREGNYFTWEEKYTGDPNNPIEPLYTAQAPEVKK